MSSSTLSSRLFSYNVLEPKDDVEERFEKCHSELSSLTSHLRENEVYNHLNEKVGRSPQDHEEITLALLYSILTDPPLASKSYHTLTLVSRDSLGLVTTHIERIIMEKMGKLQDHTRTQVLWLIRAMVETRVSGADSLCFAILKQLPAGTTSTSSVLMAENVMHMILDNREWLIEQPGLVSSVVYTYLSIITCYVSPNLTGLREQAARMCVDLIRTRFDECVTIGRDLIRLLQVLVRIPAVTELWKDLILHPQKLGPQFAGIQMLLSRRSSRRFIAGRILMDAEIKLNFLLSKVKFGQHKKYQEWFQKQYLSSPESLHQIPELIRFVCCVIHPTNEILASDVIPRWAVIGWLLSLSQASPVLFGNAKLSLFYDWLFYNADNDNIMNIEPAILLMHHSLRSHPQLTASLLDFICRIATNYHPDLVEFVTEGIKNAFRDVLQKGVLLSLDPLFESSRLDNGLRALVKTTFPDLCHHHDPSEPAPTDTIVLAVKQEVGGSTDFIGETSDNPLIIIASEEELEGEDPEVTGAFSDSEDTTAVDNLLLDDDSQGFVSLTSQTIDEGGRSSGGSSASDPWTNVEELPGELRDKLMSLRNESDLKNQVELLEELLQILQNTCGELTEDAENSNNTQVLSSVAIPLVDLLIRDMDGCETMEDETERMCDCLFRHISSSPPSPPITPSLVTHLHAHLPKLGFLFLTFLFNKSNTGLLPYKEFTLKIDKKFTTLLVRDLKECVEADTALFYQLLPKVYKQFPKDLAGNHELLNVVVANIDPSQLHGLMQKLTMKEFQIFGKHSCSIKKVIDASITWDSFEQFCVWQLLCAETPDLQSVISALAGLNVEDHPEALSSALIFLRTESSSYSAIGELLSLPEHLSSLVDAVGLRWISGRPTKYGKLISQFLDDLVKQNKDGDSYEDVLTLVLTHLQRLFKLLTSNQVLEAAEMLLAHTLSTIFKQHASLLATLDDLHSLVSTVLGSSMKSDPSSKKQTTNIQQEDHGNTSGKRTKHSSGPKSKKRKTSVNKDVLL